VAEVHFAAGYVPANQSIDLFTQACRSIGEPILGRPLHEISVGRLLAQLFQITEQFEMETQPQLLMLQKTIVLIEGVGRRLDPRVNIWTLAQPLIADWMRTNRGPEARIIDLARDALQTVERLPSLLNRLERLTGRLEEKGLHLDESSVEWTIRRAETARHPLRLPLWIAVLVLAAIALRLWL
jgi:ubiquinone biosynthesis protein